MINEETTPQVIEMEKFVLGSMLLKDGLIIPDVAAILSPDDFYRPEHKLIYNSILKLYHTKVTPNILSLIEDLRTTTDNLGKNLLDKIEIGYVLALTEIAHTTAYSIDFAQKIKEKSEHRKLIHQAEIIAHDAQIGLKSPLDIIADTTNAFNEFKRSKGEDFFDVSTYIASEFYRQAEKQQQFADRKSGFFNLDKFQLWKPGLYILGATPACGKTTFAWQLLEQFAENGENCFFCSYEMDNQALAAKTIARRLYCHYDNPDFDGKPLTSTQLQFGKASKNFAEMSRSLFEKNLKFTAKKFVDEDVNKLIAILRPRIRDLDRPPIICIDYLQRLIPSVNKPADTRSLIDDALFKLKDFATETNSLILAISTFNRANYNSYPSFENFKESGGVEYTADAVFAMQLNVANKLTGEKEPIIRKKIEDAKNLQPREISLRCLKNRNGCNYEVFFKYFSAYDFFQPCEEFEFLISNNTEQADENADEI